MNREAFQQLTRLRLKDARALIKTGHYSGAYYLAGYSVECAVKASIARKTARYDFPNKKLAEDSHCHDLDRLLRAAGLSERRREYADNNPEFADNWAIVKDWKVES